ncbi:MAG: 50S ribosomal protein L9 [bacterium]|nr:50S ribosomal protein L9 [bacterium]MCP4800212.1 50S ribosomal protein L9 [bacterium]
MEIILKQSVEGLGEPGQIVTVANGYARNYLIPQGFAVISNDSQKRIMAEEERLSGLRSRKQKKMAEELSGTFNDVSCTISVQADEEDNMYGSVGERDIAAHLVEQGHQIDYKQVILEEPIKELGVRDVAIRLHKEVEVSVKVWVVKAEA